MTILEIDPEVCLVNLYQKLHYNYATHLLITNRVSHQWVTDLTSINVDSRIVSKYHKILTS